eukprot:jgi/Botrbrau1/13084/Bobra.0187s0044.1
MFKVFVLRGASNVNTTCYSLSSTYQCIIEDASAGSICMNLCAIPDSQQCEPCEDPSTACRRLYSPDNALRGAQMIAALNSTAPTICGPVPIMDSPALRARAEAYAVATSYQELAKSHEP